MVFQWVAVTLLAQSSVGAVITVGPGESFFDAAKALNPGDTLKVQPGTYTNPSKLNVTVNGTPDEPVVIEWATPGERPLINQADYQNTINIAGATYLTIRGLEIIGGSDGINMSGNPHHITIEDCVIHDVDVGVNFRSAMHNIEVRRNEIYNTVGHGEGMYIGDHNGNWSVFDSLIEFNYIHDNAGSQGDGIEIKAGSYNNIVRHNVIHDSQQPCILTYRGHPDHPDKPNIIEGNVVWNCGQGITVMADSVVRNNIVIDVLRTQTHAVTPVAENVTLINNTVIGSISLSGWGGSSRPETLTVANNVVYGGSFNPPAAAVVVGNVVSSDASIFVDANNNDFWPGPGSPLIGAADASHATSFDFNGTPRASPFDVGAYQTGGLATNPGWVIVEGIKILAVDLDELAPKAPEQFAVQ